MNHLCALQRADGKWDYTYNRRPYGYCRAFVPLAEDGKLWPANMAKKHNEKMRTVEHKFHDCGHDTKEEAEACYKEYLLDNELELMPEEPENADQQNRCKVCNKFTACYAKVEQYRMFNLCPEHQTREEVAKLLDVGESWGS